MLHGNMVQLDHIATMNCLFSAASLAISQATVPRAPVVAKEVAGVFEIRG